MTATGQSRQDDRARFEALYVENYGSIYSYVARRASPGGASDVTDIVAEVFTVAWRRRSDLRPAAEDRLWLFGVARRCVLAHYRRTGRTRQLVDRLISTHSRDAVSDSTGGFSDSRVSAALERLRPSDREVLLLALWDELNHADIASILHCSTNAVALRLKRAKARLEVLLDLPRTTSEVRALEIAQPTIHTTPKLKEV
jgi:RNA polymerase sigma-70 factor (ECF subfamily)